jgi:predicted MFS family arabinose efflux permease
MGTPSTARTTRTAARRVAAAQLISLTGSEAAFTALVVAVYNRTHSPSWISAVLLVAFWTGGLLTPFAGSLGDRFDRRVVVISADLAGAAAFALLAFAHSPWALLLLTFLDAAAASPTFPALSAAVPNLAAPEDLAWANGTISFGHNVGHVAGPALGGLIAATAGPTAVFLANAVSFVVSAALIASVKGRFSAERSDGNPDEHPGVWRGFGFIARDPVLRLIAVAFIPFAVAVGSVMVAELPLATSFGAGSFGFGMISASFGAGALAGALLARRLDEPRARRGLVIGSFVTAAFFGSVAGANAFWIVLVAMVGAGCSDAIVDVAVELTFQRRSPDAVRSRVLAGLEGIFLTGLAVSFLFAGAFVETFGPSAAYALAGAGCLATALLLTPLLRARFSVREQGRR